MAVYSATKAFVQTFSEAVHEELHGTGVSCTALCPGPVPTEWAEIANAQHYNIGIAQVSPRDVAEAAISGMLAGRRTVVPGLVPKAASLGGRFPAVCSCPRCGPSVHCAVSNAPSRLVGHVGDYLGEASAVAGICDESGTRLSSLSMYHVVNAM
jgi:NAD(P)-dependent dehydrogenase (short-subunit alcohol dehydrogenase family)